MNTAEYLIKKLEELGINDIFGLPGDYNFNILYAIEDNPNVNWIGCTNELNAGYAADGYARMRGYGAIVTTYGVGELSAINAVAGSMAENVPVISIVGVPATKCLNEKRRVHHNFLDVDCYAFAQAYEPVTETTAFLNRDNAKLEIDRVLKVFVKEKKPVYIAIPVDIAKAEISDREVSYEWKSDENTLKEVTAKITTRINNSKSPVILGDILINRFDSKIEYKEFVESTGIPVTHFLMGTTIIDMDYKNYIGGYFGKHKNPAVQQTVESSDCLISVGAVYSDLNSYGFNIPFDINNHIAIYGTHCYVDGKRYDNVKMSDVLESVTPLVDKRTIEFESQKIGYEKTEPSNDLLSAKYIYPRLQEFIKENDIVVAETGVVPLGIAEIKFPNNVELLAQTLWGSIGWATPAAFGASKANPNSRVILVTGEGSHQLTCMEVGNMIRQGLKPVIIVINNNGYTIERALCDRFNDKFNDIVSVNYSKFARVFEGDVWTTKVVTEEDFDKALKVTQIMNKLCYIEVCTSSDDMPELARKMFMDNQEKVKESKSSIQEELCENPKEEEIQAPAEGFIRYETVVHKTILEDE